MFELAYLSLSSHSSAILAPKANGSFLPRSCLFWRQSVHTCHPRVRSVFPILATATSPGKVTETTSRDEETVLTPDTKRATICLIVGFERFNLSLYREAAKEAAKKGLRIHVFTDEDLAAKNPDVGTAISESDVLFASLVFDYDHVEWLRSLLPRRDDKAGGHCKLKAVFVFESALELMQETRVGKTFSMARAADKKIALAKRSEEIGQSTSVSKPGIPAAVKTILQKFGLISREEDKLAGYLSLLKNAPRILKLVPGRQARDLRNWLQAYCLWNASGSQNLLALFDFLASDVLEQPMTESDRNTLSTSTITVAEFPNIGLVHPSRRDYCFADPAKYVKWYEETYPDRTAWPRVGILLYRKHVVSGQRYIFDLVTHFESKGIVPVPVFITGVEAHIIARDYFTSECEMFARARGERIYGSFRPNKSTRVDAIVNTIGFPLVGGPAGSMAGGRAAGVAQRILRSLNIPYIVSCPLLIQDLDSWMQSGVAGLQSVVLYALPELDGAIDSLPLGGLNGDSIQLVPDRLDRLTGRLKKWINLRRTPVEEKRIAILLYGFPPGIGACGTAALLNVPESLSMILKQLHKAGYEVGNAHELTGEELVCRVREQDELFEGGNLNGKSLRDAMAETTTVETERLKNWLGPGNTERIERAWKLEKSGGLGSSSNIKTVQGEHLLGGIRVGNVWIGVQPPLGIVGDPMRLLFERDLSPHPQYAALYRWLEMDFKADALIHLGTHGTVEWQSGSPLGSTAKSWPDIMLGDTPVLYVYTANNPSEASIAKRRGFSTIITHNVPPYGRSGLYNDLAKLKNLCSEWLDVGDNSARHQALAEDLAETLAKTGLGADLGVPDIENNAAVVCSDEFVKKVFAYLATLEQRLFSSGLHVFGKKPTREALTGYLDALLDVDDGHIPCTDRNPLATAIADEVLYKNQQNKELASTLSRYNSNDVYKNALKCAELLVASADEEVNALLRGLNGEYIDTAPGGDLLRDGPAVLPTGRNCFALDPYRMPSRAAFLTGKAIAESVIEDHLAKNNGAYPETVAVPLWGLDNIKSRGESVGMVLGFVGAEPTLDGTGRIARFDLIPLEVLKRPRVDVVCNLSGIFRDSFEHVVNLLDDMFARAAALGTSEGYEMNFIAKHSGTIEQTSGGESGHTRLFSNPPGDYGSMVNERVAASSWTSGDELAETYVSRNSFIYGRNGKAGRKDVNGVLRKMLQTTSRVVQCIDSVEYGLSDIQEYYANTGALVRAAQVESCSNVDASIVESFGSAGGNGPPKPRDLRKVLRMELRSRLLNPKWIAAMKKNGAGGSFEISTRMTALVGWAGTVEKSIDGFVFEQAAERFVLDDDTREHLKRTSPQAFRNVVSRLIEAHGRGMWQNVDEDLLARLRSEYDAVEDVIEGVSS